MLLHSEPHWNILPCEFLCVELSLEEGLMQCKGGAQADTEEGQMYLSKVKEKYIWEKTLLCSFWVEWQLKPSLCKVGITTADYSFCTDFLSCPRKKMPGLAKKGDGANTPTLQAPPGAWQLHKGCSGTLRMQGLCPHSILVFNVLLFVLLW